jgi:hypothetical protein
VSRALSAYEQETITSFNKADDIAHIFTYERTWQKHPKGKAGMKRVMDNGFGGREYELPKSRTKPPRAPRRLSDSAKKKVAKRLHKPRFLSAQNLVPVGK